MKSLDMSPMSTRSYYLCFYLHFTTETEAFSGKKRHPYLIYIVCVVIRKKMCKW